MAILSENIYLHRRLPFASLSMKSPSHLDSVPRILAGCRGKGSKRNRMKENSTPHCVDEIVFINLGRVNEAAKRGEEEEEEEEVG